MMIGNKRPRIESFNFDDIQPLPNRTTNVINNNRIFEVRQTNIRTNALNAFSAFLKDVAAKRNLSSGSNVEVEVRLGVPSSGGFNNGVPSTTFDKIINKLNGNRELMCTYTNETDYQYERTGNNWNRLTENNGELKCISKEKIKRPTAIELRPKLPFDCRISANTETLMSDVPKEIPNNWICKRHKERQTWTSNRKLWKMELTKVTQYDNMKRDPEERFEVELELEECAWECLVTDGRVDIDKEKEILTKLWSLLVIMLGNLVDNLELEFEEVKDHEVLDRIKGICWDCVAPNAVNRKGFPGTMPVAFSRRHFPVVQNSDYFISEKTDGVRYMLLLDRDGVYIIGRKFDVHKYCSRGNGLYHLANNLAKDGCTLIDGEIVEHFESKELVFMVFDVLYFNGMPLAHEKLQRRIGEIGRSGGLVSTYRELLRNGETFPFSIIGKKFFRKDELMNLNKYIVREEHDRFFRDGQRRNHRTDGFIFTPDEPYNPRGTENLFKWKYMDLLSVDVRVSVRDRDNARMLTCKGNNNTEVPCGQIELTNEDKEIVDKILAHKNLHEKAIILEVVYDPVVGMWRFHTERTDKDQANHITVVLDTMEAIAENISVEELFYRL